MKTIVLVVLNNFRNDSRVLKEAISLQKCGFKVKVVALHDEPLMEHEVVQGVGVHRIRLRTRDWPKNGIVQSAKYVEFIYRVIRHYQNADFIHCNDLNTLPVGVLVKIFFNRGVKIVYDAHELEINDAPNESKSSTRLKYFFEYLLIKHAHVVFTVSDSIADYYSRLYGIARPLLVLNAPPFQMVKKTDLFRKKFGLRGDQVIYLYQGGLTKGRNVELLLKTFSNLAPRYVIIFMGYGPLTALVKKFEQDRENIFFHPAVSPEVLLSYTVAADFGFSITVNDCLSSFYSMPNKLFEYLMAEVPVIVSDLHDMKMFVENNGIGVVIRENSAEGICDAIDRSLSLDRQLVVSNMRKIKRTYSWEEQEKILVKAYRALL